MAMIRNVIFDLDGTLLDTSPGIIESVQYTIRELGWQTLNKQQLLSFIGPPLGASFVHCCGCSPEEAQHAVTVFRKYYQEGAVFDANPYDGILQLCAAFCARGIRMAAATNKPERFAVALLHRFGLDEYIHPICGADEEGTLKKSDLIRLSMQGMQAEVPETVLIGDTENDAEGARQTGVHFLAVTYGFGFRTAEDVKDYAAIGIAETPAGIADILL